MSNVPSSQPSPAGTRHVNKHNARRHPPYPLPRISVSRPIRQLFWPAVRRKRKSRQRSRRTQQASETAECAVRPDEIQRELRAFRLSELSLSRYAGSVWSFLPLPGLEYSRNGILPACRNLTLIARLGDSFWIACVHFPHHCPCPWPHQDKFELADGQRICVSKGGFHPGEAARKVELARSGRL